MSKAADGAKSFGNFLRECRVEIGKITWPNRHELVGSACVVGALIALLALFVFLSDAVLGRIMHAII